MAFLQRSRFILNFFLIVFLWTVPEPGPAQTEALAPIAGTRRVAEQRTVVNFADLAREQALAPAAPPPVRRALPRPQRRPRSARPALNLSGTTATVAAASASTTSPSPLTTASFPALPDDGTSIPPDTMGAVGPQHVMTTLNSQVRIQDRNGNVISTVALDNFWSKLGNYSVFDPRIVYDPFQDRWIFTAAANSGKSTSAVLVGVTETSDPRGAWFLYSTAADLQHRLSADFDNVGFNKKWIAVTVNLYPNNGGSLQHVAIFVFDKAELYANGPGTFTELTDNTGTAFSLAPAATFDGSLETLYLIEDWDGTQGQLRISTITGPVGGEVLSLDTARPATTNLWETLPAVDNMAPQFGSTHGLDLGDSRLLCCQYRNGSLWCAQNAFLPPSQGTRGAAQWWQITPDDGSLQQFGRVDDPTGATTYGYPSVAANSRNDMLIGYSRFSPLEYVSANYSFRFGSDPPDTLRADTTLKAGAGTYFATDTTGLNRWGDYSSTMTDPVDDLSFWTIQQYAATPVGSPSHDGSGVWGTWWGRIAPDLSSLILAITRPANNVSYPPHPDVTITANTSLENTAFTTVEFFADATRIGAVSTAPYTFTWPTVADGPHTLQVIGTEASGAQTTSTVINITAGDLASPIGTWEAKLGGAAKGTAYVIFDDTFRVTGHGMSPGVFGLFTVAGDWTFDQRHEVVGSYSQSLAGLGLFSGQSTARIQNNSKLTATVVSPAKGPSLKLTGAPAVLSPDLTGRWTAHVHLDTTKLTETYQLTRSTNVFNMFDLTGQGPGYAFGGAVLVTAGSQLSLVTTNGAMRSLTGKLNAAKHSATLSGGDDQGRKVTIQMTSP